MEEWEEIEKDRRERDTERRKESRNKVERKIGLREG